MRRTGAGLALAATDLANHLACRHLTQLDRAEAEGHLATPRWRRAGLDALRERGIEHERAYLDHLAAQGLSLARVEDGESVGVSRTLEAMRAGADAIVQAPLASGRWSGRADVLLKVPRPSALGPWSYEALDTKLARETKAGTILQLMLYSDLLGELQGGQPERMYVVSPRSGLEPESFRVDEFQAYYRLVRRRLEAALESEPATYPDPVPHCDLCRWWAGCDRRRRQDDHLSLVAGISRLQTRELESRDVGSLERLAAMPLPLPWRPRRGAREGYARVREQAKVQLVGRREARCVHELLDPVAGQGLERLPPPSPGDLFLDLEGDPYVGDAGLEYLFGLAMAGEDGAPTYVCQWATGPAQEKAAFEQVVDAIQIHWERFPDLHVYHYGAYEPAALKRLMGRYATREREVDRMLRAGRFVDLHSIVRQALRASVERYSIKDLEPFYGLERAIPLRDAASWREVVERGLELAAPEAIGDDARRAIEAYNRDDCVSAMRLRQWLEALRAERERDGIAVPRPAPPEDGTPSPDLDERERRAKALAERLVAGVPADPLERSGEQRARWLLANLLEWHRREEKAPWWEYYRLLDLSDEELFDERSAISGLTFVGGVESGSRSPVERYSFPPQETSVRERDELHARGVGKIGGVVAMDPIECFVDLHKTGAAVGRHPSSAFKHKVIHGRAQAEALERLGDWVVHHGLDAEGPYRAARDLLLNLPPRLLQGEVVELPGETVGRAALRLAKVLDHGVLVIQGPPGAGKTFTSARMICELVRAGHQVGVSAQSHKVIRNLLEAVIVAARERGESVTCGQKLRKEETTGEVGSMRETTDNGEALEALKSGSVDVLGGTAWMWARKEFHEAAEVLFVDEAGQMSLANVLAVSQGAKSLVLVGDPQQLEQPIQGSHPEGAGVSALDHVLAGRKTLPHGRGLFLDETWRLHPSICSFTSEQFYEGRLKARAGLERQSIEGPVLAGSGLWFVPVDHQGNQSAAAEEVDVVAGLVSALIRGESTWTDDQGQRRELRLDDVLVVAPYNAQVADLARALPRGARVGTVDRFQGQEAPVVIVSMTTSAPEDAPRGMEFLYSLNRLNVATSRAKGACILVASPRLFEPDCRSPRQMQLANALCRYFEMATTLPLERVPTLT
jgi:predicted RecB family nuclease